MPSHMTSKPGTSAPKRGRRRRLWIVPVVLVVLLAAAYLGGVAAFNVVFMPGTTLDGTDVSLRPVSEVAAEKGASLDGLETHVTGDGLDVLVRASDIGLTCDGEAYARSALAQVNAWAWPYEIFQTRQLSAEAGATFDRDKLVALIQPTIDESAALAAEQGGSGISYNAESGAFELSEGTVARHINVDSVVDVLEQAFSERRDEVVIGEECLDVGDSLTTALDTANSYLAATLTLNLGGSHAYDVTAEKIAGWVVIADDLSVSLDTAAIDEWGHGELSEKLDTVGTERTYTRPDGKVCTVNDGAAAFGRSTYGWIIDGGATAEQVAAAIQAGQPATIEIPTLQTAAAVADGGADWGTRWIDVDISEQQAYLYDNGELLWSAPITTGQPNLGNDTPSGVWYINNMQSGDINLRGPETEDGTLEWDSHVQFWLPFVGNIVGFHNAPWQSVYGGQIYLWNGSHGCVRMSYDDAQALYAVAKVGDAVVVHS